MKALGRFILICLVLIPASIGVAIGLIVSPFIHGFMVAHELIAQFIDGAADRTRAYKQQQEAKDV